jgi:hypothetical protein
MPHVQNWIRELDAIFLPANPMAVKFKLVVAHAATQLPPGTRAAKMERLSLAELTRMQVASAPAGRPALTGRRGQLPWFVLTTAGSLDAQVNAVLQGTTGNPLLQRQSRTDNRKQWVAVVTGQVPAGQREAATPWRFRHQHRSNQRIRQRCVTISSSQDVSKLQSQLTILYLPRVHRTLRIHGRRRSVAWHDRRDPESFNIPIGWRVLPV